MKRLSACSERCGYCGRCDDTPRHEHEPLVDTCFQCGASLAFFWISIANVGAFCSKDCAATYQARPQRAKRTA